MNEFVLVDTSTGNKKYCDSRSEAEEKKEDLGGLGNISESDLEIRHTNGETAHADTEESNQSDTGKEKTDESKAQPATPVEKPPRETETVESVPTGKPDIEDDPVDWMPAHFVDEVQGVPTLNRKGYAVMAERFNVSVKSEPVVRASESDFEYAEFEAIAVTEDGEEYSGFGSAHVDRMDGDDRYLLNELAETRAMKRACSWALGLGMTAKEEMSNTL